MSTRDEDYAVINGWLSQKTDGCNCGPGPMGEHEPHCQWEPLAKVEDIARMDPVDGDVIERAKVVALEGVHREDCFDFEHKDCKVFAGNVVSALADAGLLRNPKEGQTEVELEKTVGRKAEVQCSHCGDRGICPACRGASTGEPGMQCLTCHGTHECPFCPKAEADEETGATLIATERRRQVEVEYRTKEHDKNHYAGDLSKAAAVYALPAHLRNGVDWPWQASDFKPCPNDRVRELVKAGALIAAEIDRLRALGEAP